MSTMKLSYEGWSPRPPPPILEAQVCSEVKPWYNKTANYDALHCPQSENTLEDVRNNRLVLLW